MSDIMYCHCLPEDQLIRDFFVVGDAYLIEDCPDDDQFCILTEIPEPEYGSVKIHVSLIEECFRHSS